MQLDWDPEIDTPATISVIGGGPCGVEAALYGRFLGYSVELFDAHKVGDSLVAWGSRPMPGTWRELTSSLGLAAIEAHEHPLPDPDQVPTFEQYVEQYLLLVARTDLLYTSITVHTPVLSASRLGCTWQDATSLERRAEQEFRLLLESTQRGQFTQVVDIVFDCSGGEASRGGLATGGGQPIGWRQLQDRILLGRRRVLTRERPSFSGKRVMLIGNDAAAAANAIELAQLAKTEKTQLFWVIPKRLTPRESLLQASVANSPLSAEEVALAESTYREADGLFVVPVEAWGVEALREESGQLIVTLQRTEDETLDFSVDQVIHCGDVVDEPNYEHNLRLEPIVTDEASGAFVTREPHFYRLGGRSVLPSGAHPFEVMRQQIRHTFGLIGGRAELNLYETVKPQGWR